MVDRYVRPGRLRLEAHLLTFVGEDSVRAGRMAAAAAIQGRLWSFTDAFYANQGQGNTGYVTDEFLDRIAARAGVDVAAARRGQDEPEAARALRHARDAASRLGVRSTPSFFVRRGDGAPRRVDVTELTPGGFSAALDDALAGG